MSAHRNRSPGGAHASSLGRKPVVSGVAEKGEPLQGRLQKRSNPQSPLEGLRFSARFHPRPCGPVEEIATSTSPRARRTSSHAPKGPNVSSRRRKPTGRRRPIKVLFLDGRPARTGPVARRERVVVPRSRSAGLRLRLLTWCPYGASRAQVFQQALAPEATPSRRGAAQGNSDFIVLGLLPSATYEEALCALASLREALTEH